MALMIRRNDLLFRDHMKQDDFQSAFPYWEYVYENAPAADGVRATVYSEGRKLLMDKFYKSKNKKSKIEFAKFIFRLAKEEKECYPRSEIEEIPEEIRKFYGISDSKK